MPLSEVKQTIVTDHDIINSWPAGWMDRHFRDETRCNVPSLTCTSYEKRAINDTQKDELTILDRNPNRFSANSLTNSPSLIPSTIYSPNSRVISGEENCFDTADHTDNSWLIKEAATAILNLHADLSAFLEICKQSGDLFNSQNTTATNAIAARKMKDVLPNQITLSTPPPQLQLNFSPKNLTTNDNKKELMDKWYCVFCFNNARFAYEKCGIILHPELDGPWRTHVCKNSKGLVICPALSAHVCRHCGATGKSAHTEKYCDTEKKRRIQRMKNLNRVG